MKRFLAILTAAALTLGCVSALGEAPVNLSALTMQYGFRLGAPLSYWQMRDTEYLDFVKSHFNSVTMTNELKAYSMLDERGSRASADGMPAINFSMADQMVGWAAENGIGVRGHVLVWDAYMVDWYFHEDYDPRKPYADAETIRARTKYYIETVVTHFEEKFPGVVYCWDVVNEAVADSAGEYAAGDPRHLRTMRSGQVNAFQKYMGDDYVYWAFLWAKDTVEALGADIKLYYNDYNAYFPEKAQAILYLCEEVNSFAKDADGNDRVLCDGIGMQGYIGGYGQQQGCLEPSHPGMIRDAIRNYADHGFEVQVTEMAVRNFDPSLTSKHAAFYADIFRGFLEVNDAEDQPLKAVSIWGITDNPSDKPGSYTYSLNSPYCGLFDEKLQPKEAYTEVLKVLTGE